MQIESKVKVYFSRKKKGWTPHAGGQVASDTDILDHISLRTQTYFRRNQWQPEIRLRSQARITCTIGIFRLISLIDMQLAYVTQSNHLSQQTWFPEAHKVLGWFWKAIVLKTWGVWHPTHLDCIFLFLDLILAVHKTSLENHQGLYLGEFYKLKQLLRMWPDWTKPALQVLNFPISFYNTLRRVL